MKKILFFSLLFFSAISALNLMDSTKSCEHNPALNCTVDNLDYLGGSLISPRYSWLECTVIGLHHSCYYYVNSNGVVTELYSFIEASGPLLRQTSSSMSLTEDTGVYYIQHIYINGDDTHPDHSEVVKQIIAIDKATYAISYLYSTNLYSTTSPSPAGEVFVNDIRLIDNKLYVTSATNYLNTQHIGDVAIHYANGTLSNNYTVYSGYTGSATAHAHLSCNATECVTIGHFTDNTNVSEYYLGLTGSIIINNLETITGYSKHQGHNLNENYISNWDNVGNEELYINHTTRLTETAGDELILSYYEGAGDVLVYSFDNKIIATYLCSNNVLDDTCTGKEDYGTKKPKLKLGIIDDSRCPYGEPDCSSFALFNEDYILAYYTIDDKIALPPHFTEYSESYPSTSYVLANASCTYEGNTMQWGNASSDYVNIAGFSEKQLFVSPDANVYAGDIITITCTSDVDDSNIWNNFYVQNTQPTSNNFNVNTGNQNGYNQPHYLDDSETHIKAQWNVDSAYGAYYACLWDWETPFGWLNTEGVTGDLEIFHNILEDTPDNMLLTAGYNRLIVQCRAQELETPLRASAWTYAGDILFNDIECADGYYSTTLTDNGFYDAEYGDYLAYEFEAGRAYDLNLDLFAGGYDFGYYTNPITTYCTTDIYNLTGDLQTNANIYSYFWEYRAYDNALDVGNYSAEIRCFDTDDFNDVSCINPTSLNVSFNITAETCDGTYDSCGYGGVCNTCGTLNVECEDGTYNIQQQCVAQKCSNSTTEYDFCFSHQLYAVDLIAPEQISCIDREDVIVNAQLLRNQQAHPWGALPDSSCRFGVYEYITPTPDYSYAGTYEASADVYSFTPPDLLITPCDTDLYVYAQCLSSNFSRPKTSMAQIQILTGDYCVMENSVVIPAGTCAFDITANDEDKGLYCNAETTLVNRGDLCDCPRGTTLNATSLKCDGQALPGAINWFLDGKFLTIAGILMLLIFAPLILKAWEISKRR